MPDTMVPMNDDMTHDWRKAGWNREDLAWRARYDLMIHSDRAAVDIGLVVLKTAILMNAGTVVVLLAFVGQLWSRDDALMIGILGEMTPFLVGLIAAGLCAVFAYFYQSVVTERRQIEVDALHFPENEDTPWARWIGRLVTWFGWPMIGSALLSYGAFIWGALGVKAVLTG